MINRYIGFTLSPKMYEMSRRIAVFILEGILLLKVKFPPLVAPYISCCEYH